MVANGILRDHRETMQERVSPQIMVKLGRTTTNNPPMMQRTTRILLEEVTQVIPPLMPALCNGTTTSKTLVPTGPYPVVPEVVAVNLDRHYTIDPDSEKELALIDGGRPNTSTATDLPRIERSMRVEERTSNTNRPEKSRSSPEKYDRDDVDT